jgi:hypothetical protein
VNQLLLAPYGVDDDGLAHGPNPTQQKILDWYDNIKSKYYKGELTSIPILYIQGGNGSGKTRGLLAVAQEAVTSIPIIRILWGRQDFKDLKLSVMDTWQVTMPQPMLENKSEQYHYYDYRQPGKTNGRIYFNGLKDLGGFGSQEFGIIIVTEAHQTTLQMFRTLLRRCRQKKVPCMILMESEPPNSVHWLNDLTDPEHEDFNPDVEKWELTTYENWKNLDQAYRGSLEKMPEAAKRKYLLGKSGFSVEGKPFYSGYKHDIHTGEFEHVPGKLIEVGWDFGFHFPAVVATQMDPKDRWIWLREKLGRDITIQKFGEQVIAWLSEHFPDCPQIHYGDPACDQVNDKSEKTSKQILADMGILIRTKPSTYATRKEIMERRLSTYNDGKPQVMIDYRHCPIAADGFMGGYRYPTKKEQAEYDDDKLEVPYRDGFYEHIMNAGEYVMVNKWKAVENRIAKTRMKRGAI